MFEGFYTSSSIALDDAFLKGFDGLMSFGVKMESGKMEKILLQGPALQVRVNL